MGIKLFLLIIFFAVMVGVGFYSRRHVKSVDGFVLGGRSVGPWLTAFASLPCRHQGDAQGCIFPQLYL